MTNTETFVLPVDPLSLIWDGADFSWVHDEVWPSDHLQRRTELNMRAGGFGILVARNLVDELIYIERGNEVILVKYL
jgi:hypothetical protein